MSDWHGIYYLGTFEHTDFFFPNLWNSCQNLEENNEKKKGKKDDIIIDILLENVYLKHLLLL